MATAWQAPGRTAHDCPPSAAADLLLQACRESARRHGEAETLAAAIALFVTCAMEWGFAESCAEILRANADYLEAVGDR